MSFLQKVLAKLGPYDMNKVYTADEVAKHWANWWDGKEETRDLSEVDPDAFSHFKDTVYWDKYEHFEEWVIRWINLDEIDAHYDAGEDNPEGVEKYAKKLKAGSEAPPIIAIKENGKWKTVDGAHRLAAAIKTKQKKIRAFVPKEQV